VSIEHSQGYPAQVPDGAPDTLRVACVQLTAGSDKAANLERSRVADIRSRLPVLAQRRADVYGRFEPA
jgi:hypothetical protein